MTPTLSKWDKHIKLRMTKAHGIYYTIKFVNYKFVNNTNIRNITYIFGFIT